MTDHEHEHWTMEQVQDMVANWQPTSESFRTAMSVVTASLADDEEDRRQLLTATVTPFVLAGPAATMGTLSALVAMMVRSVNTLASFTKLDKHEMWARMATELEAEIVGKLEG